MKNQGIFTMKSLKESQTTDVNVVADGKDEFCEGYDLPTQISLPLLQAVRGQTDNNCGLWIGVNELAKADWHDFNPAKLTTYIFENNQQEEQGLFFKSARMLVVPRSGLLAFDREASNQAKSTVVIGEWKPEYKEMEGVSNLQYFEVILLDENNKPLHSVPFRLSLKGATQASFSQHLKESWKEVTNCHAAANGIIARDKDMRFKSLCVFIPTFVRELAGKKNKGWACKVGSHLSPTLDNWKEFFVGFDPSLKNLVGSMDPTQLTFQKNKDQDQAALPASVAVVEGDIPF